MLTYDVSDKSSFDQISSWLKEISIHAKDCCFILLIGNKTDLESKRQVSYDVAK